MNDVARMVATIAIWLILGVIMIVLSVLGSDDLTGIALFLVIGAIACTGIIWGTATADRQADARAKAKRHERLAQRLTEEELVEEDIVTLEELLEEQRATRRLQDS